MIGVVLNRRLTYWYLLWNLFLAWIPLGFSVLASHLQARQNSMWLLLGLWLLFLPNTFYMVTDYIHIAEVWRANLVFDTVMFSTIIGTAYGLGLTSIVTVHTQLLVRYYPRRQWHIITGIIALSSIAIYLGRELRWNSWDIFYQPFHIMSDILAILTHPALHSDALLISAVFFVMTFAAYWSCWNVISAIPDSNITPKLPGNRDISLYFESSSNMRE